MHTKLSPITPDFYVDPNWSLKSRWQEQLRGSYSSIMLCLCRFYIQTLDSNPDRIWISTRSLCLPHLPSHSHELVTNRIQSCAVFIIGFHALDPFNSRTLHCFWVLEIFARGWLLAGTVPSSFAMISRLLVAPGWTAYSFRSQAMLVVFNDPFPL